VDSFGVTYFALPIIDKAKIEDILVALSLLHSHGQAAEGRLLVCDPYLAMERFGVQTMARRLRDKRL